MSKEQAAQTAEITASAPEQAATAAPVSEVTPAPEQSTEGEQKPRVFTQEELDAAIGKRLAREQRKWEREQQQRFSEQQPSHAQEDIKPEQFESTDAYADALAERKSQELLAKREQQRIQSEIVEAYHDREEDARTKYDDFEQVAYNPNLRITEVMAQTIQASDIGPDLAYYLGSNPKEADRISRLAPIVQAKEIGKLEAKLAAEPPKATKTSNAPAPIAPVTARTTGTSTYDTTDPRSIKSMTTSEWIEADRKRQMAKMAAARQR